MSNKKVRLFVGPMSKEIVDTAISYVKDRQTCLGLIPSRRQIENTGGYVNNWTTREFSNYIRSSNANIVIARDHGGPLQGSLIDDGFDSMYEDLNCNFDLIHVDPWKSVSSINEGIDKTCRLIENCCDNSDTTRFEIGTEAAIFQYTADELETIIKSLMSSLGNLFSRVDYAVVQSGVQILGTKNVGVYDPAKLKRMVSICREYGLLSKEHNGDYLTKHEIASRVSCGLDCINIAPEFGVIQTRELVKYLNEPEVNALLDVCRSLKKYEKWLPTNTAPTDSDIIEVSGHYAFSHPEITKLMAQKKITELVRVPLYHRFDEIISCWDGS